MSANTPPPMGPQQQGQGQQQQQQGLPPTGLQQQMSSLNSLYSGVQGAGGGMGFDPRQQQFAQAQMQGGGALSGGQQTGSSSLDQMARNLAQRYGMPVGRGRIVDDQGNFLFNPQQMADASGGQMTMGEAAANMNYIGQAIARQQNEQQRAKGIAAIQTGLGQVQSNARGSMAGMMSGMYQSLASVYTDPNQSFEAKDYSFYIQKEQNMIQQELMRRQEKLAKKQARGQFFSGIGMTVAGLLIPGGGALAAQGAGQAAGAAGNTGWF